MTLPPLGFLALLAAGCLPTTAAPDPAPAAVAAALRRSADWQLAHPSGIDTRDWIIAPLYDGLLRTGLATGEPAYLAAVLRLGTQSGWMPGDRVYHADEHAVGHAWLDLYLLDRAHPERLAPCRERFDRILAQPITEALTFAMPTPATPGVSKTDRWTWCDALYMAPPTGVRLYAATGDRRYLDFVDREFRATYDQLYDPAEHLFYRDARFPAQRTPAGRKVFWSRGNGWVYGGLALLLEHLPADHPTRGFYETLFREMTAALLAAQQPDGLWRPSLLDPEQVPVGETSGSGFFVFGLAWGVNHGLLDRAAHWPAITRGWAGLLTRVKADGAVGYVQKVADAPSAPGPDATKDYGTGAFLLAGSEVLRGLGGAAPPAPAALLAAAEARLAAEATTPRAYARLVPERKDDLAWENDKVAFRIYGPALRQGEEDSGIDIWFKRVPYPIVDRFYFQDRTQHLSYHQDHGEGYDGYKVGATRGCGGLGFWVDGRLVTADTYTTAAILWTEPGVAEFKTVYRYPLRLHDRPLTEERLTRLRLGDRLCEVTCVFTAGGRTPIPRLPHPLALGLATQHADATVSLNPELGYAAVYERIDGVGLGTGVVVAPAQCQGATLLPSTDATPAPRQALLLVAPDADGRLTYRAGFAWAGDGDITTPEQWYRYLELHAGKNP